MAMSRWNPVSEMMTQHDAIDHLLAESFVRPTGSLAQMESSMPIDMDNEDDKLIVKAAMPGIQPENIDIDVQNDVLTITGEMKSEESKPESSGQAKQTEQTKSEMQRSGNQNWYLREHHYARYTRSITLPFAVQADKAEAMIENGILTLQLPKAEQVKQKKIQVKTK